MAARRPRHFASSHDAYTLVELLIVIMIAVLLMVVTLPMAKTVMEDARPREASRILNTTILSSKAKSSQTGRLAGIEFVMQRMNDPMAAQAVFQCTQMYMCEVPSLYMGDTTTAVATVDLGSGSGSPPVYDLVFQDQIPAANGAPMAGDSTSATMNYLADQVPLQPGSANPAPPEDVFEIRFNHRGPWYPARRNTSPNQFQIVLGNTVPVAAMSNFGSNSYRYSSFQIRRPPVRVGNPVELPKSTCIDMTYSGVGQDGIQFGTANALRVMFSPSGNVHSVTMSVPNPMLGMPPTIISGPPLGTVHFMIGLISKVNLPLDPSTNYVLNMYDPEKSNLADGNALWVSISRSSGVVTTNENGPPEFSTISNHSTAPTQLAYVTTARQYATAREQKGGR